MQASFWTIYKRGRFLSRALTDRQRIEQRERFGVACLALCLRHDNRFCNEFVSRICGVTATQPTWRIDVDPYREGWADILLQSNEFKIVIECKIDDDLKPKQDPWHIGGQFVAQKRGYGRYFHDQFPSSKRTYVVLTATRNDSETRRLDTICRAVTWSQLRRLPKTNGKWVRDLFLSLANLDYPEFRAMKTKDIHVTHVGSVLSCHEILSSVADRLGVSGWKIQHVAEIEEEGGVITGGYVGIDITAFKKSQRSIRKIKRAIRSPSKYHAWFGYELTNRSPGKPLPNLSVWFYCGKTASKSLRKVIGLPAGWKIVPPQKGTKEAETFDLHFSKPAHLVTSDVDDFLSLLGKVIPEIGTK
jgi:hypothetical protein